MIEENISPQNFKGQKAIACTTGRGKDPNQHQHVANFTFVVATMGPNNHQIILLLQPDPSF